METCPRYARRSIKIYGTQEGMSRSVRCKFPGMPISVRDLIAQPPRADITESYGARLARLDGHW